MGRKKLTKQQIKDKAKAAAKRLTYGKVNKAVAMGGPAAFRGLEFMETGDGERAGSAIISDYSGFSPQNKNFILERLSKGWGGSGFNLVEKTLFRGAGVKLPPLKPKNGKDFIRLLVYNAGAVANASGGSTPKDKFVRWYHSHYGVKLDGPSTFEALDYSKPILEKDVPYIIVNKLLTVFK